MVNLAVAGKILSRLGASKGGFSRAEQLTGLQRSEIARKAANKRWRTEQALQTKTR